VFFQVGLVFGIAISKYRDIGSVFRFFARTIGNSYFPPSISVSKYLFCSLNFRRNCILNVLELNLLLLCGRVAAKLSAGTCYRSPACRALSSKPVGGRCCCRSMGQTDRRTDARPFHRPCSAYYASSVNNWGCWAKMQCS